MGGTDHEASRSTPLGYGLSRPGYDSLNSTGTEPGGSIKVALLIEKRHGFVGPTRTNLLSKKEIVPSTGEFVQG
jgi:hypothetical protein